MMRVNKAKGASSGNKSIKSSLQSYLGGAGAQLRLKTPSQRHVPRVSGNRPANLNQAGVCGPTENMV